MFFLIWLIMYTAPIWGSIIAIIWFLKWVKKKGETEGWRKVSEGMTKARMVGRK